LIESDGEREKQIRAPGPYGRAHGGRNLGYGRQWGQPGGSYTTTATRYQGAPTRREAICPVMVPEKRMDVREDFDRRMGQYLAIFGSERTLGKGNNRPGRP